MTLPSSTTDAPAREGRIRDFLLTTVRHDTHSMRSWTEQTHPHDELLWVTAGVTSLRLGPALYTLGGHQAFWVPRGVAHSIDTSADSVLQATFFADNVAMLGDEPSLVELKPAVRELLLLNADQPLQPDTRMRLQRLVVDLLVPLPFAHVDLRMPHTPHLLRIAEAILADPAGAATTAEWADRVGVPRRRLSRSFVDETGYSLTQWRIRVRVRASLVLLSSGVGVIDAAHGLGYASVSTFIAHFRSVVGTTPGAHLDAHRDS